VEDLLVELMELVSGVSTTHADFSSKKQNGCIMFVIDSAVGRSCDGVFLRAVLGLIRTARLELNDAL
jgi:hypothetical protein